MLRRKTGIIFRSSSVRKRWYDPNALTIRLAPSTIFLISDLVADTLWSHPSMALSSVKCFSITHAPLATAASGIAVPIVWSEKPIAYAG